MMNRGYLVAVFLWVVFPFGLVAQTRESLSFIDRCSFKTNAFEWLATVPNFGVEYDIVRTDFRKMSLALTGKCNWNTYHSLVPATVFDMSDIRPEFRYYFRTGNMKVSRPWWVMYLGPYMSYGTYTFKLGKKGLRGNAAGVGLSAGYVVPMYEYRKGTVDVELGLSVGLQMCQKDVFTYDPEGYSYIRLDEECRSWHMTPFPVLSEVRVAFAWRKESVRHQVHIDEQKVQAKVIYRKYLNLMHDDIDANLPLSLALEYDDMEKLERDLSDRSSYLAGENAIGNETYGFTKSDVKRLHRKVKSRCAEIRKVFLHSRSGGGVR